ncbi:MAG: hypothetical protein IKF64_05970 [Eubacterium sp.]|nr:hypothetical protein [Eubacterium sp.]
MIEVTLMKIMTYNFLRRAVIIPLIITAVFLVGMFIVVKAAPKDEIEVTQNAVTYRTQEFTKLSDLDGGAYVGKIKYADYAADITYAESYSNSLFAAEGSTEPWNNGTFILEGTGAQNQLGAFRGAKVGDAVTLEIYSNDSYDYKITNIEYGFTRDDISKLKADGTLFICRSYYDLASGGEKKLYAVYTAKQA